MEEIEIATRFLQKINKDNNLVVIDFSVSAFDGDITLFADSEHTRARQLTCRFSSHGQETVKRFTLLQPYGRGPEKWIKSGVSYQAKIVPTLEEILSRISMDNCQLAPQLFESNDGKNPYIIMEDLTYEKFKEVSDIGLGSLQIARYLAGFHAASIVMFRENPNMRNEFPKGINLDPSKVIENVAKIVDEIDSWSDRKWSQKLKHFLLNWEKRLNENVTDLDECLTLNSPAQPVWWNILMRYRGCGHWDVRFQNFTCMLIQSPIYDLMHFIMSSITNALRFKELDHILKYYHSSFTQFCALLGVSDNTPFNQFRDDFRKKVHLAFYLFCFYCGPGGANFDKMHFLEGLEFFEHEHLFNNETWK